MDTVKIDTAQNVQIDYNLASLGDRMLAFILDMLVLFAYILLVAIIAGNLNVNPVISVIFVGVPVFFYFLLCEVLMDGQSIGKRVRSIKVVMLDGSQASFGAYLLRWIIRPVDYLMGIGFFSIMVTDFGQRLGDLAAGTTVIKLEDKVTLDDTLFVQVEEDYRPTYTNVNTLENRHIELIKKVLKEHEQVKNYLVVERIYLKTKEALNAEIPSGMPQIHFLEKVVKDYNYYLGR